MTTPTLQQKSAPFLPKLSPWLLTLTAWGPGCGTETGNPGDESQSLALRESVSVQAGAHLLEVSESLEDTTSSSGASLGMNAARLYKQEDASVSFSLAGTSAPQRLGTNPTCTTDGNDAVIQKSRDVTKPFSYTDAQGQVFESLVTKSTELEVRYSRRDDIPILCGSSATLPVLSADAYRVLDVSSRFDAQINREFSLKSASGDMLRDVKVALAKTGQRSTSLSIENEGTTDERHICQVTSSHDQSLNRTKNGDTREFVSAVATEPAKPLVFALKKAGILRPWTEATLRSGSLAATLPDGSRTITRFENVTISREAPCAPLSGNVTGSHYRAETSEDSSAPALLTYTITFEGGVAWIQFGEETEKEELPFNLCTDVD